MIATHPGEPTWDQRAASHWRALWQVPALHVFAAVRSTNDVLRELAEQGLPAGTTVIADAQTDGRGRRQRRWEAPAGTAILMSVLMRPAATSSAELAGTIPIRVGLAVARAIESVTGVRPRLKWPNDLLAQDGRKLAGILCESSLSSRGVAYSVVGIGINVLQRSDQFEDDVRPTASSLAMLLPAAPARSLLAEACLRELNPLFEHAVAPLTTAELDEYARRDALAGREISADGQPAGTADGVGTAGELLIRDGDERRTLHNGTIRVLT